MLKKLMVFILALALQVTGLSCAAEAQNGFPAHAMDTRVLQGIGMELDKAGTSRALAELPSGEIVGVDAAEIAGAWLEHGQVWLSFAEHGAWLSGRYMEPDRVRHADAGSSLSPAPIDASEAGNAVGLDRLAELTENCDGTVIVAVLDTGTDLTHPWFQDRIASAYDAVEEDDEPQDRFGHGTHIAGIIVRNTPANVKVMPVRVIDDEGDAPDSIIVKGIHYAVNHGADIINLSLGGYGTTAYLDKAIDYAFSKGVLIVAAAGNDARDGSHYYPAAFPEVLAVGATGSNGDLLYFSNTGEHIDVCAPGEKIVSAMPGNTTGAKSGTSMAAPLVSSAAAMLLLEDPSRSAADLERLIVSHVCDRGAPGKDKLFGYGELTFENYRSDPDFYLIEPREEGKREEKYSLNLSFYAGSSVKDVEIKIDGATLRRVSITSSEAVSVSLDIRNLAVGSHKLEVRPVFADGTPGKAYVRDFVVPEYNVRIRAYDAADNLIRAPQIDVLGFSQEDGRITKLDVHSVLADGIWMANMDFDQLARKYDKIRVSVASRLNDGLQDVPFYFRIVGTTGEKVFETSECSVLGLSSKDRIPGCAVTTRILGSTLIGFSDVREWGANAFETAISTKDIPFAEIPDGAGQTLYAGLLYYDKADLWMDIYSYAGGQRTEPARNAEAWYYSGRLDSMDNIMRLDSSSLKTIRVEADLTAVKNAEYMLLSIPTGDTIINAMTGPSGSVDVATGFYDIFLLTRRVLKDGSTASDAYFNSFHTEFSGKTRRFRFGDGLKDDFIFDAASKRILHRWTDAYGNGYSVAVFRKGKADGCVPSLFLADVRGKSYKLEGTESHDSGDYIHAYSLARIPNGTYRLSFINDDESLAFPVKSVTALVTILNGTVYAPGNTPPVACTNYASSIKPGDLFVFDLREEFSDKEQAELRYTATAGWIVDGLFFYRDLIGQDAEIVITAYDGVGGSASFKHTIRVTDRNPSESDYTPIPDIDSLGASSWAVPYVRQAIEANIVPAGLLDEYQAGITRREFSALIVRMAEKFLGQITPTPGVRFADTTDQDVLKAASLEFLTGSGGYFRPDEYISRQQLCVIIYQAVKVLRPDLVRPGTDAPQFRDVDRIASWAREAVNFCSANHIIVGNNGMLNPAGTLSREQAIVMVCKAFLLCSRPDPYA